MGQRNLFYSVMAPFSWLEYLFYFPSRYRFILRYRCFISSVLLLPHIWQYSSYPYWTTLVLEGTLRYLGFISCSFIPPCPFFILKNASRTLFAKRIPFVSRYPIRIVVETDEMPLADHRSKISDRRSCNKNSAHLLLRSMLGGLFHSYTKTIGQRRNNIERLINAS